MDIGDSEQQFREEIITFPDEQSFVVIVGQNNSGKSTILRSILRQVGVVEAFRIDVNRTSLQGKVRLILIMQVTIPVVIWLKLLMQRPITF